MKVPAPNYTQTPNELFDHWLPHLSESELKVLLVIMRKTFGWHKSKDAISITQLAKYTGMLQETVISASRTLQNKGLISRNVQGDPGKQVTYYELIIIEDSNNLYPSVKPTPPLGLSPLGSTESQKKAYTKETIQKKQQQASPVSAAVVFVDYSKKVGEPLRTGQVQHNLYYQDIALGSQPVQSTELSDEKKPKIYTILENIGIPIQDKEEITRNHSIEDVTHAIKWATSPMTVINKSLAAAIKWACKTRPTIPQQKVDIEKVNREYAKKYDEKKSGNVRIDATSEAVVIVNGNHSYGIKYSIKTFMEEFRNALTKNNFKLLEA